MTFDLGQTTTWDRELLLSWFLYRMPQETRRDIMREFPQVYNRLYPRDDAPLLCVTMKVDSLSIRETI
jgi:hypothetical protein